MFSSPVSFLLRLLSFDVPSCARTYLHVVVFVFFFENTLNVLVTTRSVLNQKQSCTWWAPSAAQDKKEALRVRRRRENGSGPGNLHHDGFAEEARSPSSCTSTRAVGCGMKNCAQILQLRVEQSVLLNSLRVVLLNCGEKSPKRTGK